MRSYTHRRLHVVARPMMADRAETRRRSRALAQADAPASEQAAAGPKGRPPLPLGISLLIWAVMAALAWGVVVLALRFL